MKIYSHGTCQTSSFTVHFAVHVPVCILEGYINSKTETRRKEKLLDYIVLGQHRTSSTGQSIQSEYCSTQGASERHNRSKLFMTLPRVTIIITEVKILLLLLYSPFHVFTSHFQDNLVSSQILLFWYLQGFISVVGMTYCGQCSSKGNNQPPDKYVQNQPHFHGVISFCFRNFPPY